MKTLTQVLAIEFKGNKSAAARHFRIDRQNISDWQKRGITIYVIDGELYKKVSK